MVRPHPARSSGWCDFQYPKQKDSIWSDSNLPLGYRSGLRRRSLVVPAVPAGREVVTKNWHPFFRMTDFGYPDVELPRSQREGGWVIKDRVRTRAVRQAVDQRPAGERRHAVLRA